MYAHIRAAAAADPSQRKLFVRGLAWETGDQDLHDAFAPFGEVEEAVVIVDRGSGRSRGYGFVTFATMEAAHKALVSPTKVINVSSGVPEMGSVK